MSSFFRTDTIKRFGKKAKSKRGATLIEMVATLAILTIVATLSLEAMFMAYSEQARITNISESQRSISLMQENLNKYLKTAVDMDLCTGYASEATIDDAIREYTNDRNSSTNPLQDHDIPSVSGDVDDYNDYIFYRSGTFSYTLAKYYRYHDGESNVFVPIFTVDNIKELYFSFKKLTSVYSGIEQYIMDYSITSPTNDEFVEGKAIDTDDPRTPDNDILKNIQKGEYSIATGTILNNMYGTTGSVSFSTAVPTMRISEGLESDGGNDGSDKHFLFIRTTPKVAI